MANYILADNQDLTCYAFETLIRQDRDNRIFRATDKAGLIDLLKRYENAVVLLDYSLFDFAGDDQLLILSERFPMTSWLLLSDSLTPMLLKRLLYTSHRFSVAFKSSTLGEIREALRAVERSERYVSQRAMETIISHQAEEEYPSTLTTTEREIVRAIAQGKTTKEIAAERISSIHTITTHRRNIFHKLGINTAHEVVKYAIRAGLVDPSEF